MASGDVPVHLFLLLDEAGSKIGGSVDMTWGRERILSGSRDGDHFELRFGSPTVPIVVSGTVQQDRLDFDLSEPRQPTKHLHAQRIASLPAPAAKLPLPSLLDVAPTGSLPLPLMGWNSWNAFNESVFDADVRQMADLLVASGLKDAGFQYVMIDEGWTGRRAADGTLMPNRKFPDMPALSAYLHARGLKLGLYTSPGPTTCGGYPGSHGFEQKDARQFAAWGVDYLKDDWCSAGQIYSEQEMQAVYQRMGEALAQSGRSIVLELCQYGLNHVSTWGPHVGASLWRTTGDIADSFSSVYANAVANERLHASGRSNAFNDPDMLEVGNAGLSDVEAQTQLSVWSVSGAPLVLGTDLRKLRPQILAMLRNREVIAVDQDSLAKQGSRASAGGVDVWTKPLSDGSVAVAIVNAGESETQVRLPWSSFGLSERPSQVRDVWRHADVATAEAYSAALPAHGSVLLRVKY